MGGANPIQVVMKLKKLIGFFDRKGLKEDGIQSVEINISIDWKWG